MVGAHRDATSCVIPRKVGAAAFDLASLQAARGGKGWCELKSLKECRHTNACPLVLTMKTGQSDNYTGSNYTKIQTGHAIVHAAGSHERSGCSSYRLGAKSRVLVQLRVLNVRQ